MPAVKDVGESCAREPHAPFDGGREETSTSRPPPRSARRLPSTRHHLGDGKRRDQHVAEFPTTAAELLWLYGGLATHRESRRHQGIVLGPVR
jgi:hypothetical protein